MIHPSCDFKTRLEDAYEHAKESGLWPTDCGKKHILLQTILNTLVLVYSATLITQSGFQIDVSTLAFLLAEKATVGQLKFIW